MRLLRCLVLLAVPFVATCAPSGGAPPRVPGSTMTGAAGGCQMMVRLEVDPSFTPGQRKAVDDAVLAWERGTGDWLCFAPGPGGFQVVKTEDPDTVAHADAVGAAQGVTGVVVGLAESPRALILTKRLGTDDEVFRTTVHEIGHLLGLPHYYGTEPSYMYPNIGQDPVGTRYLTERDSLAFCNHVRGCAPLGR